MPSVDECVAVRSLGEPIRVLLVEQDDRDYARVQAWLGQIQGRSYRLERMRTYEEALDALRRRPFDVCLLAYHLGGHTGLDLLRAMRLEEPRPPMILLTVKTDYQVDVDAMSAGAADFLVKDKTDADSLERSLRYAIERHRADERIREQASLIDMAHDAILVCDLQGCICFWNRGAQSLYGWTAAEALGHKLEDLLFKEPDAQLQAAEESLRTRGKWSGEFQQITKDGQEVFVDSRWTLVHDAKGRPRSKLVTNTDITEKKNLQTQFLRTQRLESIGTLAGGIAHDLNNVLTPILMTAKLLRRPRPDAERLQLLETLQASAERGAEMVKQVLAFAGGVEGQRAPVHIEQIIAEVKTLLDHTLPKSIDVKIEIEDELFAVLGDHTQLSQVLMNLCVNARDAMPQGGRLTIRAGNISVEEPAPFHAQPGPFVRISVEDTGSGIPAHLIDKVFDPFFTTKPPGKGTGLGLSTVLGIVQSHGGFIQAYSEAGQGTKFTVHLPAVTADAGAEAAAVPSECPAGRGQLILVVDDETFIVESARSTLEEAGYRVLTATDGRDAIALYQARPGQIDAVLLDMMMPVMDGPATIRALQEIDPNVRIIATSGLRLSGKDARSVAAGARALLQKPYSEEQLLAAIGKVLRTEKLLIGP
jgi:two-component system, cell cycle sensor histidine kinase and response regulator CckA